MTTHDHGFGAVVGLEGAFDVASLAIGTPEGLLRVVGFHHVLPLHLQGDDQVGLRVGVGLARLSKLDVARHVGVVVVVDRWSRWSLNSMKPG